MTFSNLTIAQKMTWLSCAEGEGEMTGPTLRDERVNKIAGSHGRVRKSRGKEVTPCHDR